MTGTAQDGTPGETASEDPDSEAARTAREAAWAVEHGIDELRETFARVALALDRARAATAGSAHPLPARALHGWADALELTGQARAWLGDGVGELRRVPGVRPIGTAGDLVTALNKTINGVRRTSTSLVQVRARIDSAAGQLEKASTSSDPAIGAAVERWRRGIGVLDELTARVQHGVAALSAYTVTLTVLQTLLLVDLLVDERLTGAERAGFRAEAVELALSVEPGRWPAGDGVVERDCDG